MRSISEGKTPLSEKKLGFDLNPWLLSQLVSRSVRFFSPYLFWHFCQEFRIHAELSCLPMPALNVDFLPVISQPQVHAAIRTTIRILKNKVSLSPTISDTRSSRVSNFRKDSSLRGPTHLSTSVPHVRYTYPTLSPRWRGALSSHMYTKSRTQIP